MKQYIVNVAVDIPLYKVFSYLSDIPLAIGTRVMVQFGRKDVVGFVWENNISLDALECKLDRVKPILEVFPERLTPDILSLIKFCSSYYHYPVGQTVFSAIPRAWRKPTLIKLKPATLKSGELNTLSKIQLNAQQQQVVAQISQNLNSYYPGLLYGITGSGKTEVYLELIERVLKNVQQVLVLVPEINLTPQLLDRFKRRFPNCNMHVLTSNATPRERLLGYTGAMSGDTQIIIGTRLAIFTPFNNLGLILVDEEHDLSFKQQDNLRYHARDLAVWRAKEKQIPLLLGSATPSLETLYNYKMNKYTLFKLTSRAVDTSVLPEIKLIDINLHKAENSISKVAEDAIETRLKLGELSLVFINRRGYAPIITCYECGWVGKCSNCSANLVFHRSTSEIKCHHCGISGKVPKVCPACNSQHLQTIGQGTQKIEEQLNARFPQARVYRIDQDTLSSKKAWGELYDKINRHEIDILVGTQILVKGHDFHNLTLVIGLNIDNGLYSYDFRASEFLFTQLTQVAGRAGRGDKPGQVLLQTMYPKHDLYQFLIRHDFSGFVNYTLKQRKSLLLPPYTYSAMLRVSSKDLSTALEYLHKVRSSVKIPPKTVVHQPVPAVLQRLKNRERGQMLILSSERQVLHSYLTSLVEVLNKDTKQGDLMWQLDVDPFEM